MKYLKALEYVGVSGTLISVAMTFANDITSPKNRPAIIAWIYSGFSIAAGGMCYGR